MTNLLDPIDLTADTVLALEDSGTTPVDFKSYVKHVKETVDPSTYLGFLTWYSVPGKAESTYQEFADLVERTGAPVHIAKAPKPVNVFRRGCTQAQNDRRKIPATKPDVYYNYHIRETGHDDDKLYRKIVREEVDHEDHSLGFVELGDLTFVKETARIKVRPTIDGANDPVYFDIIESIREYVKTNALTVTSYTIRQSIRGALESAFVQAVRVNPGGGVYFVSRDKAEVLAKIEHLCSELEGVTFELPPLLDDGKQRELLRTAFQEESVGKLQELMTQCIELSEGDKKVTEDQWIKMRMTFEDYRERANEFSNLLDDALSESDVALRLCEQHVNKLRTKVAV